MQKYLGILFALVLALSFSLVPAAPASAAGTPIIDGVIDAGEWDGATVIPVASGMGNVSVLAYTDYLYVLFNVTDSTDARLGENLVGNDKIGLNINPTDGGPWGKPYDIVFQTGADPAAFTTPDPNVDDSSSGMTDGWETEWCIVGNQLPLPLDAETMTLYDYGTGTRISEWKVPLASIAPSAGDSLKVGGACDNLHVVGGAQGNSYSYPPTLEWGDPFGTFVDVLVQANISVGLVADAPEIIAISVTPTSIDFGTIRPGDTVPTPAATITVENIGTVTVDVDASLVPLTGTVFNYLQLGGAYSPAYSGIWDDIVESLLPSKSHLLSTQLVVPSTYSAKGVEEATVTFIAAPK